MKTLVAIVAVLAVLGGAAYWYTSNYALPMNIEVHESTVGATTTSEVILPSSTAPSNQTLDQDLSAIDSQLSGLSSDTASASASLNDKQVSQSSL